MNGVGGSAFADGAAPFALPANAVTLWTALNDDTLGFVLTIDAQHRYTSCNGVAAASVGKTPPEIVGRTPHEVLAPELAESVAGAVTSVFRTGTPAMIEAFLFGQYIRTTFRPLRNPEGAVTLILIVGTPPGVAQWRPGQAPPGAARGRIPRSDPLSKLSPRELEVLGLLGRGMSVPEAARHLHRSARTVEAHRYAIGQKLKVRNQAELAQVARLAGLAVQVVAPTDAPPPAHTSPPRPPRARRRA